MTKKSQIVDTKNHPLAVFDGRIFLGTLTENAAGIFYAFTPEGRCVGAYPTMLRAARALPDVTEPSE